VTLADPAGVQLAELLRLQSAGPGDVFESTVLYHDSHALFGGQAAAQGLAAAGATVSADRVPHALYASFLRPGDPAQPVRYFVDRGLDGRTFSQRLIKAVQSGKTIMSISASFQRRTGGESWQVDAKPSAEAPSDSEAVTFFRPFLGAEIRRPPTQPVDQQLYWPLRLWLRIIDELPDNSLAHACALTYLSDASTGVLPSPDGLIRPTSTLDHALWFHGPIRADQWMLMEFHPRIAGQGRGWYSGEYFDEQGRLLASVAQTARYVEAPQAG
jgi:acyl-CoA thioesterase-2